MQGMTLREVCNMLGVTRRAVQGYERTGMVTSSGKNKYGYLLYEEEVIEKIRWIKQHQNFGFSLKEIKVLLESSDKAYVELMTGRLEAMKEQLNSLTENIQKVERLIAEKQK